MKTEFITASNYMELQIKYKQWLQKNKTVDVVATALVAVDGAGRRVQILFIITYKDGE